MNTQSQVMQDKDLLNTILTFEKHMSNEYAIAVTESNCQVVRQMFTSLLDDTLQTQNDVFKAMSQHGWYQAPAKAVRQEVDKQVQTYQQTEQQLNQLVQQHRNAQPPQFGTGANYGSQQQPQYQHSMGINMQHRQ